jgi:hypothetical protein
MEEHAPVITLVKKAEIAARPPLSPDDLALENTLEMLCSFLTLEDFISFLQSPMFQSYACREEVWLVLEIGLYRDHTKTLQLYPEAEHLAIADEAMTGGLDGHVWKGVPGEELMAVLQNWMHVVSPN